MGLERLGYLVPESETPARCRMVGSKDPRPGILVPLPIHVVSAPSDRSLRWHSPSFRRLRATSLGRLVGAPASYGRGPLGPCVDQRRVNPLTPSLDSLRSAQGYAHTAVLGPVRPISRGFRPDFRARHAVAIAGTVESCDRCGRTAAGRADPPAN